MCRGLQSFGGADKNSVRSKMRKRLRVDTAGMGGGHCAEHDACVCQGLLHFVTDLDGSRKFVAGEVGRIFPRATHGFGKRRLVDPHGNVMWAAAAGENNRERRAPAPAAEDRDLCHAAPFFLLTENLGSSPRKSRWMFARCGDTTSIAAATDRKVIISGGAWGGAPEKYMSAGIGGAAEVEPTEEEHPPAG